MPYGRRTPFVVGAAAPFDPTSIPGIQVWYDASDASSFTFSSGVVVSQWNDKAGVNNRNITDGGSAAKGPSRNGTQNGLATCVFDGTSDYLTLTPFTGIAQPLTVIGVVKYSDIDTTNRIWFATSSISPQMDTNSGKWDMYAGLSGDTGVTDDALWHVHSGLFDGASSAYYLDGIQIGGALNPGTNPWNIVSLGAYAGGPSNYWQGEIAEVLVYTSLSSGNRQAVQAYLKAKWGTP